MTGHACPAIVTRTEDIRRMYICDSLEDDVRIAPTSKRLWLALAIGTTVFAQTSRETEDQTNLVYQPKSRKEGSPNTR